MCLTQNLDHLDCDLTSELGVGEVEAGEGGLDELDQARALEGEGVCLVELVQGHEVKYDPSVDRGDFLIFLKPPRYRLP